MLNKFKNNSGTRYLNAIFYETTGLDKSTVVYTLKDREHLGYPSLKQLYLQANDLTEYKFALSHLDGFEHWQMLCECTWFQPYIEQWRVELIEKVRSQALFKIRLISEGDEKDALAASKYLLEWLRKGKEAFKVGRPRKDTTLQEQTAVARSNEEIDTLYQTMQEHM